MGHMNDPFILANQAVQIFYVKDLLHLNCHVVIHGKMRIVGVENVVSEDEYNQFDELPPIGVRISVDDEAVIRDETCYVREDDCEIQVHDK
jgi:hypothetical protein